MIRRLPAEWEQQDGVLLAWPHADSDWRDNLAAVEAVFVEIVRAISRCAQGAQMNQTAAIMP